MNRWKIVLLCLAASVFSTPSRVLAQNLDRLAPPLIPGPRLPTRAQGFCARIERYVRAHPGGPAIALRSHRRWIDVDPAHISPLQTVGLRYWMAHEMMTANPRRLDDAISQAAHMTPEAILAHLRTAWRVPATATIRYNWSLRYPWSAWCQAANEDREETISPSEGISGSLVDGFCIVGGQEVHACPGADVVIDRVWWPGVVNAVTDEIIFIPMIEADAVYGYFS
ncbi:hypothetical protein KBB27_01130 [Patescibacteria group bacterium]|nr:hypothetical protein [Patescibacteria group bacterium]